MANNTYVIDVEAPIGPTVTLTDDGTGSDWLTFNGVYTEQTSVTLHWSYDSGVSTSAAGTYWTDDHATSGRLVVNGLIENVRGSNGADEIIGNEVDNILYGDNAAMGAGGNDVVSGDEGNDLIYGGAGSDDLSGMEGNDTIYGGIGADTISGGSEVDVIQGGAGADSLSGGSDIGDTVSYSASGSGVTIRITYGSETIGKGGDAQGDKIYGFTDVIGSTHNDVISDTRKDTIAFDYNKNKFDGGAGNDIIQLGGGNDTGIGASGADKLYGEIGNDTLNGGAGLDKLIGGQGKDKLTGGAAADVFIFTKITDSTVAASGRDTITDFSHAQHDKIDLSAIDANGSGRGNADFDFIGTHAFTGHAGELRIIASGNGFLVQGNIDSDKAAEFAILVQDVATLRESDFIL